MKRRPSTVSRPLVDDLAADHRQGDREVAALPHEHLERILGECGNPSRRPLHRVTGLPALFIARHAYRIPGLDEVRVIM